MAKQILEGHTLFDGNWVGFKLDGCQVDILLVSFDKEQAFLALRAVAQVARSDCRRGKALLVGQVHKLHLIDQLLLRFAGDEVGFPLLASH